MGGKRDRTREEYEEFYRSGRMSKPSIESRDYQLFKKKQGKKLSWYERTARFCGKILDISPGGSTKEDLESAISFTGMEITPKDVMAMVVLTIIGFVALSVVIFAAGLIPVLGIMFVSMIGVGLGYYFLKYPNNELKNYRIRASSQVVLAVLYMVVSMRVSPNLEVALRFASANISGPLAWDMRRLLWDIEMGKYYSATHAVTDYISKWKAENEEFAEALRLIRDSQSAAGEKLESVLDEALTTILEGTKVRMKHYAQELTMPVTIIHMMGIILPVLGSIMAPMAAIFLSDIARPEYFIIGYDIVLPLFIIWFINSVLKKRPTTFSEIDTSSHPDLPPKGSFIIRMGKKRVVMPVIPISILIAAIFIIPAVMFFAGSPELLLPQLAAEPSMIEHTTFSLIMSCMITMGIAFSLSSYFLLTNFQKMKIQGDVQKTESEFEMALFQLGNRISGGIPTELALEQSVQDVKDLRIAGLFTITLRNMKTLGMTFKEAIFNGKWGSIRYYPSNLIRNIMYMIVDIAKKGIKYASSGMLTVAKYLRNIRETQEYIRDMLQESVSSMTFQAYLLTPMITGLIVSMSQIIITVLTTLTQRLSSIGGGSDSVMPVNLSGIFGAGGGGTAVSPELFQIIIGVYLIEVIIILAIFITKITQGENKVFQWHTAGKMMAVAIVIYFLVAMGSSFMFADLISQAISTIT